MTFDKAKEEKKRKKINEDILKRLKSGENLQDDASKTWFPPRPIIKKDANKVKELYGENVKILTQEKLKVVLDEKENIEENK